MAHLLARSIPTSLKASPAHLIWLQAPSSFDLGLKESLGRVRIAFLVSPRDMDVTYIRAVVVYGPTRHNTGSIADVDCCASSEIDYAEGALPEAEVHLGDLTSGSSYRTFDMSIPECRPLPRSDYTDYRAWGVSLRCSSKS